MRFGTATKVRFRGVEYFLNNVVDCWDLIAAVYRCIEDACREHPRVQDDIKVAMARIEAALQRMGYLDQKRFHKFLCGLGALMRITFGQVEAFLEEMREKGALEECPLN